MCPSYVSSQISYFFIFFEVYEPQIVSKGYILEIVWFYYQTRAFVRTLKISVKRPFSHLVKQAEGQSFCSRDHIWGCGSNLSRHTPPFTEYFCDLKYMVPTVVFNQKKSCKRLTKFKGQKWLGMYEFFLYFWHLSHVFKSTEQFCLQFSDLKHLINLLKPKQFSYFKHFHSMPSQIKTIWQHC